MLAFSDDLRFESTKQNPGFLPDSLHSAFLLFFLFFEAEGLQCFSNKMKEYKEM